MSIQQDMWGWIQPCSGSIKMEGVGSLYRLWAHHLMRNTDTLHKTNGVLHTSPHTLTRMCLGQATAYQKESSR